MPGITRDEGSGLIRPTTARNISIWARSLYDIRPHQIWDWLRDVGLSPRAPKRRMIDPSRDYAGADRAYYLQSALANLDAADPSEVRRLTQVLEECLLATGETTARDDLAKAIELDGFSIDQEGNILAPVSAGLFEIDLTLLVDSSALTQQLRRIHENLHSHPEESIDGAAALVAAALKQLLASHGVTPGKDELPSLAASAKPLIEAHYRSLGLAPDSATRLVQSLAAVVNAIAPVRNADSPTHPALVAKESEVAVAELVVSSAAPVVRACLAALK